MEVKIYEITIRNEKRELTFNGRFREGQNRPRVNELQVCEVNNWFVYVEAIWKFCYTKECSHEYRIEWNPVPLIFPSRDQNARSQSSRTVSLIWGGTSPITTPVR